MLLPISSLQTARWVTDTSLGEVAVTDSDDGNNAVFTISIVDGDDTASKFKFVGNTLMTDSTYTDYDTDAMKAKQYTYTLIVTSVDSPDEGHALTGMATYIVNVSVIIYLFIS